VLDELSFALIDLSREGPFSIRGAANFELSHTPSEDPLRLRRVVRTHSKQPRGSFHPGHLSRRSRVPKTRNLRSVWWFSFIEGVAANIRRYPSSSRGSSGFPQRPTNPGTASSALENRKTAVLNVPPILSAEENGGAGMTSLRRRLHSSWQSLSRTERSKEGRVERELGTPTHGTDRRSMVGGVAP